MKILRLAIRLCCMLAVTSLMTVSVNAQQPGKKTFVHPAILNTKASLDYISQQLNNKDSVRTAAYQKVGEFIDRVPYPTSFFETVVVGSNGATSPSKSQIRKDAELVYALTLAWAHTGKAEYAQKAIGILNGWAYTFKNYDLLDAATNQRQPGLEASWTSPGFVAAAEILRYYKVNGKGSGWKEADIAQFKTYLHTVVENYINKMPVYNNNWNASQGYAKMAAGIFMDSTALYQEGYETVAKFLPIVIDPDGHISEYCHRKDCVHFQYSLNAFTNAAELARLQGDNSLWQLNDQLLSRGYDYLRKAMDNNAECSYCTSNSSVFPGTELAYRYYKTDNLAYLRALRPPQGSSQGYLFIGFTTYTHANVPEQHP
ncbi:alginate lyase [Chitinophaga dinghuensis]|uniref:Alginate lyase n=1 Tax=Chitinophaga dinghuensis TaxID=1539050 RepID=A0A327WAY6_9BACT|nr:alginate lyase family protein [Chitinophaga dinghuensis]RAJ87705.1 alginate lyase [Chitinophaga dinghuensis]